MVPISTATNPAKIVQHVAKSLGITPGDITSVDRQAWRVLVRFAIVYTLVHEYNWSHEATAQVINRERTSCIYGYRAIANLLEQSETDDTTDSIRKKRLVIDTVRKAIGKVVTTKKGA